MTRKGSRKRLQVYVGGTEYPWREGKGRTSVKDDAEYERQKHALNGIAREVRAVDWTIYLCGYEPKMCDDGHFAFSKVGWHFGLVFRNVLNPIASAAVASEVTRMSIEQDIDVKKFLLFEEAVFQEVPS